MGRQATPAITPAPEAPLDAGLGQAQQILAAAQAEYGAERDLVNQLLGQAQMADAFAKFSKTVFISKLAFVKENKLYRAIKGKPSEDGLQFQGTWEEFCNMLGWAPQHANEAINSLRSFGEEALESMSRMGIGYRELRQYRRLDGDQQQALIEAAKAGDKDGFLDLAEELISRHSRERGELEQKLTNVTADYEAQSEVLAGKNQKIDDLSRDLYKRQRLVAEMPPDEVLKNLRQEVAGHAYSAEAFIRGALNTGIKAILEAAPHAEQAAFLDGLLLQVEGALLQIRDLHCIAPMYGDLTPLHKRPDADEIVLEAIEKAERENQNGRHKQ